MQIQQISVEQIRPLRHAVLRAGLPIESAHFDGDEEPSSIHLAAVDPRGRIVGCVSVVHRPFDGQPAWQLRGMATDPAARGQGLGGALLTEVHRRLEGRPLWCNARLPAVGFYEHHGWQCVSDVFDVPTAGPHRRMVRPWRNGDEPS